MSCIGFFDIFVLCVYKYTMLKYVYFQGSFLIKNICV